MPEPDGLQFTDLAERGFAGRNQATYDAAEAMERIDPDDIVFTVSPNSPEELRSELGDEFHIRMFHRGNYQAGTDYFTDDFDEVQAMVSDVSNWGTGTMTSLLPDPTTDYAISEQADYDQYIAEPGGSSQGWDGRGASGTVSYDGGRIRSMSVPAIGSITEWFPSGNLVGEDPTDRDAYGRSWEVEASGRGSGPNYSQPDPFDRSDPEQARQAAAIEAMNKLWEE